MRNIVVNCSDLSKYSSTDTSNIKSIDLRMRHYSLDTVTDIISFIDKYNLNTDFVVEYEKLSLDDFLNLKYFNSYLKRERNNDLFVRELFNSYSFCQAYEAEMKAFKISNRICEKTESPFERLILAHDYTSSKLYFENKNPMQGDNDCINFIGAMTTKSIVCMGYAKIMQKLCSNIGITCFRFEGENSKSHLRGIHSFNIVHLKDEGYGINGYYLLDATWNSTLSSIGERSYLYLLFPIQDAVADGAHHKKYLYNRADRIETAGEYISTPLPAIYSPVVPYTTFKNALHNVYKNNDKAVERSMIYTTTLAQEREINGENCFSTKQIEKCIEK